MNIFLTGFMAAGKSTVGAVLARQLGYRFVDLDRQIAAREGQAIPAIFAEHGEDYFRDCEAAVLAGQALAEQTVFATGGGIVSRAGNRALMRRFGKVVYLRATWPTLEHRLSLGSGRPLADPQKGVDAIRGLWESRQPWYEEADLVIDTDHRQVEDVVVEIVTRLGFVTAEQ